MLEKRSKKLNLELFRSVCEETFPGFFLVKLFFFIPLTNKNTTRKRRINTILKILQNIQYITDFFHYDSTIIIVQLFILFNDNWKWRIVQMFSKRLEIKQCQLSGNNNCKIIKSWLGWLCDLREHFLWQ